MNIKPISNQNFNGKYKPNTQANKKVVNKFIAPVLMGALSAQLLKEQALSNSIENQNNNGYLNKPLTKDEVIRGQKLADCFNFYKNPQNTLFNIMKIVSNYKYNINDMFFVKIFFEFIESDLPSKAKSGLFDKLSKKENNPLLQTILVNFTTLDENSDELVARFSIPDLNTLQEMYNNSKDKEFILDLIKEGIVIHDNGIKAYRFNIDEIMKLNKCYTNTPNKNLLLTLINQYEYDESIEENCPLYNADMIIHLVENCFSKDKANFLQQICSEKITQNGKKANRFFGEPIFIFNKLYDKYPDELHFFINEAFENNNQKVPRFNANEIIKLMQYYEDIGDPVINLVKSSSNIDTRTLLYLNEQMLNKQTNLSRNKKKIN